MCVDMFERRFRQELEKLPPFIPNDKRDSRVWAADFPAWRSLFTSLCMYGHLTGYRLPPFASFFSSLEKALCIKHPNKERFLPFFQGELREGMKQRAGAWYESGMAETYLYVCLAEALEDRMKAGIVIYDSRADWKFKADVMIMLNNRLLKISSYVGDTADRPRIEARREVVERLRKVNTAESAHWDNTELAATPSFEIARTDCNTQIVNGVRLFDLPSINLLLQQLYAAAELKNGWQFSLLKKAA